jgi:hypothetical protein
LRSTSPCAVVALLFAAACSSHPVGESAGEDGSPVLRGSPSGPEDDAVVKIESEAELVTWVCTATLVAPNLLVTAQHCVSNFDDGKFSCTNGGELTTDSIHGQMGTLVPPENVKVFVGPTPGPRDDPAAQGVRIFAPQTTTICKNDIAFVVLDRDLDVQPSMIRLESGVENAELARVVGYGQTERSDEFGVRYARSGVRIALVGESSFRPRGDAVPPYTFTTQGPLLCTGDSGGPIFAESGAFLGVFSRFDGSCTSPITRNIFTQVAAFADDAARDAFDAAGATPVLEPTPGSGGSGGAPPEEGGAAGAGGEDGGAGGSTGATGGVGGSAGSGASSAGSDAAGQAGMPGRTGLRQPGGCRCNIPGSRKNGGELWLSLAGALVALAGSRRRGRLAAAAGRRFRAG